MQVKSLRTLLVPQLLSERIKGIRFSISHHASFDCEHTFYTEEQLDIAKWKE